MSLEEEVEEEGEGVGGVKKLGVGWEGEKVCLLVCRWEWISTLREDVSNKVFGLI